MGPEQITVFGASGFIGRHVVRRLAARGCRVLAAVRDPEGAAFLKPMGNVGQVMPVACNVADPDSVARALSGAEAAVNLVGILHESGRQRFADLHAAAPGIVGKAAAAAGLRSLVHVSALGAAEDSPSRYARTKAEGERALREAFPVAAVMRPSVVFGPDDDFFNRFAALARLAPVLPLFGGGQTKFQPVYVCDVADAVVAALFDRRYGGRVFSLGGPRVYSFREIMELVLFETGRRRSLIPLPMAAADMLGLFGDVAAAFGLSPAITRDQARLLRTDTVVPPGAEGLEAFGIVPTAPEVIVGSYLDRFRPQGRFSPIRG